MVTLRRIVTGLLCLLTGGFVLADPVSVTIDASNPGPNINPRMYGIFLEEINHGVDGGLYAEMIRNRAFEDSRPPEGYMLQNGRWVDARHFDSGFSRYGYTTDGIPFWSVVQQGAATGVLHLETSGGVTESSAYCLRLDVEDTEDGRIGVSNGGFFGMGIRQGESYAFSLYARGGDGFEGPLTVRLESTSGVACSNEAEMRGITSEWRQYGATLTATKTDSKARLVILAGAKGQVWLDFASLFPKETWKGRSNGLRSDISQMIADLRPGFVRFPGGCVVAGGTVETAYNWKDTVGPVKDRPERWGPWNYRQTHGMGLYEYLQFIEDVGAEPLWVGFCGQTCIFRQRENVPMDQMDWIRDNFLDIVEYANGPADSKWGAMRAEAGHPGSFGLEYVEIGNENQGPEYGERYRFVHEALKAKYPDLTYLADLSWTSRESLGHAVFDIEDRHYYNSPRWFLSRFNEYDGRDRKLPPLYLGEVAVTSRDGGPLRGNLLAALAEGVFLLGCERNSDAVKMVSYAPLLGYVQGRTELTNAPPPWHAMIYFDGTRVFGTASYYLWKMLGNNLPTRTVQTEVTFPDHKPKKIEGQIGVGTWDATAEFKDVRVEQRGQVLYASEFTDASESTEGAEGWKPDGGRWDVEDGVYRQTRRGRGMSYLGDETWTDYTLTLKARKLSGGEGFLIAFGRKGTDRYWWNLGGWGNSQHAIEFNQSPVGRPVRGRIEDNRWYDVKVEVSGQRIRCFLDGQLVNEGNAPSDPKVFAIAGPDEVAGEIILKAINISEQPMSTTVSISGAQVTPGPAAVTVLTGASLRENNSLDEQQRIVPRETVLDVQGQKCTIELQPRSLTVIRFKTPLNPDQSSSN